jgi:hypothetical protein
MNQVLELAVSLGFVLVCAGIAYIAYQDFQKRNDR